MENFIEVNEIKINKKTYITAKEAYKLFGIADSTIRGAIMRGRIIDIIRIGKTWLIELEEIKTYCINSPKQNFAG